MKSFSFQNLGKQCQLFLHPFSEAVSDTIIAQNNFLEHETLNTLIPEFSQGHKTILDIGANIGNHSVFFNDFFECQQIIAFEPHPANYEILAANARAREKIRPHNVGCSDYMGTAHIHIPGNNYGGGQFLTQDNISSCLGGKPLINNGDCVIITIDSLDLDDVTFIKADIEGHEQWALKGAKETLKRCRPILLIEDYHGVYDGWMRDEFGYQCIKRWPGNINKVYGPV